MTEVGVYTTEVASLDSGGVVDALSEWLGAHAPFRKLVAMAFVCKSYNNALKPVVRSRLPLSRADVERVITNEWTARYAAVKKRSDDLLAHVVTRAEWKSCVNNDLESLGALRLWITKRLCSVGVSRPFAVALTSHLRALRPTTPLDRVLTNSFLNDLLIGRCTCGHLPCVASSLRVATTLDCGLVFTCGPKSRLDD